MISKKPARGKSASPLKAAREKKPATKTAPSAPARVARAKRPARRERGQERQIPVTLAGIGRRTDELPLSHRAELVAEAEADAAADTEIETAPPARASKPKVARAPQKPKGKLVEPPAPASPDPAVVAQIRELEAQLDRLIDEASRRDLSSLADDDEDDDEYDDAEHEHEHELEIDEAQASETGGAPFGSDDIGLARARALEEPPPLDEEVTHLEASRPPGARASRPSVRSIGSLLGDDDRPSTTSLRGESEQTVFDTARELLSSDFYLRKWGRLAMRGRSEEVDDFGFDPIYDAKFRGVLEFLYSRYFRVETSGIDVVPESGRCLIVANHSGTLPLDGVMIKTAVKLEHPAARDVRWLTEDFIYHFPYLGSAMNRLGAVRACQENAERLLANEELVAVFPEGVKGIGKLFAHRYRLQRFGRGGFIKLCLRTSTPIVPVAVVGAEETNPLLFKVEYLSKALGLPYVPVTPTFPLLGPFGLLPAPTKWTIQFGEPIDLSAHGPEAADDEILVGKLAERVRATIQGILDKGVGGRKSVFFG